MKNSALARLVLVAHAFMAFVAHADVTPLAPRVAAKFAGKYTMNDTVGQVHVNIGIENNLLSFVSFHGGLTHQGFSIGLDKLNVEEVQYFQRWYGIVREIRHNVVNDRHLTLFVSREARTWRVDTMQDLVFIDGQLHWHFQRICYQRWLGAGKWKEGPGTNPALGTPQDFWRRLYPYEPKIDAKIKSKIESKAVARNVPQSGATAEIISLNARRQGCGRALAPDHIKD